MANKRISKTSTSEKPPVDRASQAACALVGILAVMVVIAVISAPPKPAPSQTSQPKPETIKQRPLTQSEKIAEYYKRLPEVCKGYVEANGTDMYIMQVKPIMTERLKAPSTAKFAPYYKTNGHAWWDADKKSCMIKMTSYVDAQNAYGAMIRTRFTLLFQLPQDESGMRLVEVVSL